MRSDFENAMNEVRATDPAAAAAVSEYDLDVLSRTIRPDEKLLWVQQVIYKGDEEVSAIEVGTLAVTDERVVFSGLDAAANWPHADLRGVRYERGGRSIFGAAAAIRLIERGGNEIYFTPDQKHKAASDRLAGVLDEQIRRGGSRRTAEPAQRSAPTPARSSISSELSQLAGLHREGVLTDDEFAAAKARVVGSGGTPPPAKASAVRDLVRQWTFPSLGNRTCRRCGTTVPDEEHLLELHAASCSGA